jgi:hypothetical protein
VMPTSLLHWKQAGMKRFLLCGNSLRPRRMGEQYIKMTHS